MKMSMQTFEFTGSGEKSIWRTCTYVSTRLSQRGLLPAVHVVEGLAVPREVDDARGDVHVHDPVHDLYIQGHTINMPK